MARAVHNGDFGRAVRVGQHRAGHEGADGLLGRLVGLLQHRIARTRGVARMRILGVAKVLAYTTRIWHSTLRTTMSLAGRVPSQPRLGPHWRVGVASLRQQLVAHGWRVLRSRHSGGASLDLDILLSPASRGLSSPPLRPLRGRDSTAMMWEQRIASHASTYRDAEDWIVRPDVNMYDSTSCW